MLKAHLLARTVQVVINNAGILGEVKPFGEVTEKVLQDVYQVGSCLSLQQTGCISSHQHGSHIHLPT